VINIDSNNSQNPFGSKSTSVAVGASPSQQTDADHSSNFIRGPIGNPSRNSNRTRGRLSIGTEGTFGIDNVSKSVDSAKVPTAGAGRVFVAGHSRASSADISGYAVVGHGKANLSPSTTQPHILSPKNDSNRNLHARNNSVDNSLVTSGYQTFIINSESQNSINSANATPNKPAIPAKPSGIVSVFVPGSTNLSHSTNNKSTGNIYGKVNLNSSPHQPSKDLSHKPLQNPPFPITLISSGSPLASTSPTHNSQYPVPPPRKVIQFIAMLFHSMVT